MNLGYLAAARFGDGIADVANQAIGTVTLRTAPGLPDLALDLTAPSNPVTKWVLTQVGPQAIIDGPVGHYEVAPYGPGTQLGPIVVYGALVGILATAFAAGRRSARRSRSQAIVQAAAA